MKKKLTKLSLRKETLRSLSSDDLHRAAGAAAGDPSDWSHMDNEDSQTCSYSIHEQPPIIVQV